MITSKDTEKPDHIHNLFMIATLKKKNYAFSKHHT